MRESESDLLTAAETAERLRLSRETVYEMVHRGELHAYRRSRPKSHLRIPSSEVERLLEQGAPRREMEVA
jgi:excisionase family DNA binding protein